MQGQSKEMLSVQISYDVGMRGKKNQQNFTFLFFLTGDDTLLLMQVHTQV